MSVHQGDLFTHAALFPSSVGVFSPVQRLKGGIKGQLLDIVTNVGDIGFFFDNAFISPIEAGKGNTIISFIYHQKVYQFQASFSVVLRNKNRTIQFAEYSFKDEFGKNTLGEETLGDKISWIKSQLQIFILQKIWQKEEAHKVAIK